MKNLFEIRAIDNSDTSYYYTFAKNKKDAQKKFKAKIQWMQIDAVAELTPYEADYIVCHRSKYNFIEEDVV